MRAQKVVEAVPLGITLSQKKTFGTILMVGDLNPPVIIEN